MTSRTAAADGALQGMKAICRYMGKSEPTILKLVHTLDFPATKVNGEWVSDVSLIIVWRQGMITKKRTSKKPVNQKNTKDTKK